MLSLIALLLLAPTTCPAGTTEVHAVARFDGTLTVYPSNGTANITADLKQGKRWSVCVPPTGEPAKSTGFYKAWFDEVHYAYSPDNKGLSGWTPSKHERWRIPGGAKSLSEQEVVTDGILR